VSAPRAVSSLPPIRRGNPAERGLRFRRLGQSANHRGPLRVPGVPALRLSRFAKRKQVRGKIRRTARDISRDMLSSVSLVIIILIARARARALCSFYPRYREFSLRLFINIKTTDRSQDQPLAVYIYARYYLISPPFLCPPLSPLPFRRSADRLRYAYVAGREGARRHYSSEAAFARLRRASRNAPRTFVRRSRSHQVLAA